MVIPNTPAYKTYQGSLPESLFLIPDALIDIVVYTCYNNKKGGFL